MAKHEETKKEDSIDLNSMKEDLLKGLGDFKEKISEINISDLIGEVVEEAAQKAEERAETLRAKKEELKETGIEAEKVASAAIDTISEFIKSFEVKEEDGKTTISFEKPDFSSIFSAKESGDNKKES